MSSHEHSGMSFEAWTNQQTWYWRIVSPNRNGGTIGAAASETDALREACNSIDEMSALPRGCAAVWRAATGKSSPTRTLQFDSGIESNILDGWVRSLASLERYLGCGDAGPT